MFRTFAVLLCLSTFAIAVSPSDFKASASVQSGVSKFITKIEQNIKAAKDVLGKFPATQSADVTVHVNGDIPGVFYFESAMAIDCDGVDEHFRGNPDGQSETSFGKLDASKVPWVVIPVDFFNAHPVPPNSISAVVCDGTVFYGIMGDMDADNPEVIGEVSLILGQACFPSENLNGGSGHDQANVFYFIFDEGFSYVNETQITDFKALRELGDKKMSALISSTTS